MQPSPVVDCAGADVRVAVTLAVGGAAVGEAVAVAAVVAAGVGLGVGGGTVYVGVGLVPMTAGPMNWPRATGALPTGTVAITVPLSVSIAETVSSLKFATRARVPSAVTEMPNGVAPTLIMSTRSPVSRSSTNTAWAPAT